MDRNEILAAAGHCINGRRAQDYGRPENNFSRIARLWEAYTGHAYTPENVAIMLALLKIARLGSGRPHPDNYIDLAGYAALAGELAGQEAPEAVKAVEPVEPAGDDEGLNACQERGCPACPLADGCGNYGRYPAPQAVEPAGAARSPQEPAGARGGAGAFEPCTPLGSIKLQGETAESEPEGPETGGSYTPPDSIRFYALPDPEAARPGGAFDLVEILAELVKVVEKARGELDRQGLQLVARYEIHRRGPVAGEGAD